MPIAPAKIIQTRANRFSDEYPQEVPRFSPEAANRMPQLVAWQERFDKFYFDLRTVLMRKQNEFDLAIEALTVKAETDQSISDVTTQVDDQSEALADLTARLAALEAELAALKAKDVTLQNEINSALAAISAMQAQLSDHEIRITALEDYIYPAITVVPGTYGDADSVAQITVDSRGRVTAAADVSISIAESQVVNLVADLAGKAPLVHASQHMSAGADPIRIDELKIGTDVVTLNASSSAHGLLPKLSGTVTQFLTGTGTWAVPVDTIFTGGDVGAIRITTETPIPTTGQGLDLTYPGTYGVIKAYNRAGPLYTPLYTDSLNLHLRISEAETAYLDATHFAVGSAIAIGWASSVGANGAIGAAWYKGTVDELIAHGGRTASFPGFLRVGATIDVKLATNSDFAAMQSLYVRFGANTPEGVVTAPIGSIFHRTNGAANTSLYVKESGVGNTGWVTFGSGTFVTSVSGTATRISSTGGLTPVIDLIATAVTPATYGSASIVPVLIVDAYGRLTGVVDTAIAISAAAITSGTLAVDRGGTGQTTVLAAFNGLSPITTRGDLITRDATNNIRLAIGTVGQYLRTDGTDPSWSALAVADLSGQVSVANGGTGAATLTGILQGNGVSAVTAISGTTDVLPKWSASAPYLADSLLSSGTNLVEQRNSTNAQTFRLYGTYTDASNYERLTVKHNASAAGITVISEALGTGTARDIIFSGAKVGIDGVNAVNSRFFVLPVLTGVTIGAFGMVVDLDVTATANLAEIVGGSFTVRARGSVNQTDTIKNVQGLAMSAFSYNTAIVTNLSGLRLDTRNLGVGTVTNSQGLLISAPANSGGGVVTNSYGIRIIDHSVGSTLIAGIRSELTSGTGKYHFYGSGTAQSYFGGNVGIFTTAPDRALEVNSATGINLRLTYNDSTGSAATFADLLVSSAGLLTIEPTSNQIAIPAGASTSYVKLGGNLVDYSADVSVGGLEADIFTHTTAASILGTNNDKLIAEYGGNFVTVGTELTQLKVYFAGTAIWDSTGVAPSTGTTSWRVYVEIIRVSATVVRFSVSLNTTGATDYVYCTVGELTGLTLSGTNILKLTGVSSGVGSAAGDIVGKMGYIFWVSAA